MVARRSARARSSGWAIPVVWRARTWSEPGTLRLRFQHVGGATTGMDVTWRIEPTATGCRVSIEHDFRRAIALPIVGPLLGDEAFPRFVDRLLHETDRRTDAGDVPVAGRGPVTRVGRPDRVRSGRATNHLS